MYNICIIIYIFLLLLSVMTICNNLVGCDAASFFFYLCFVVCGFAFSIYISLFFI